MLLLLLFQHRVQTGSLLSLAVLEAPLWLDVANCSLVSFLLAAEVLRALQVVARCWAHFVVRTLLPLKPLLSCVLHHSLCLSVP